jgi:hypothetical protein
MTTNNVDHNASYSMDRTRIRWSGIKGESPDSASLSHNAAPKRRMIDRKPYSGRGARAERLDSYGTQLFP